MRYNLNSIDSEQFEHLAQALLEKRIGPGTIMFGPGRDGAREATFSGSAPYPSVTEQWSGEWIFQVKYHDILTTGPRQARAQVLADLHSELAKITVKYKIPCDNYILITNVPLSGVHSSGTRDRVATEVAPQFKSIDHIMVWDATDIYRQLENNRDVASAYAHLITPGDIIAQLLENQKADQTNRTQTLQLFLSESFKRDQYAQLEQAGEVSEERLPLRQTFIDLNCSRPTTNEIREVARNDKDVQARLADISEYNEDAEESQGGISVIQFLLDEMFARVVIIGGPGEGKSTLGQYLAQIHRAAVLPQVISDREFGPLVARIPFRVVLKDYAQAIVKAASGSQELEENPLGLDTHIAHSVARLSGRSFTTEDLHLVLQNNPSLLILDGLDEVSDQHVRRAMLERIEAYQFRCNHLGADVQIVGTSRPYSYYGEFSASEYLHLRLIRLEKRQVTSYVERWIAAKILDEGKASRLRDIVNDCLNDHQLSLLMTTPLQVTIMILIILGGGTPPRQKEALFDEYLEIIYKREKSKTKSTLLTEKLLLFDLHALIGYILHRRAISAENVASSLSQAEYESLFKAYLRYKDPYSPDHELNSKVDDLIHEAGDRLVLVVELSTGNYGFELRSIQEFFAAAHLSDTSSGTEQRVARFTSIARHPHWRNVCLLLGGRIGRTNPGEAANVIEICRDIDREQPFTLLCPGRWLAMELAAERAFGTNRGLQNSLIEYALSIVEVNENTSMKRASTLLRRLPSEDFRDHVLPHVRSRLEVLDSRTSRRLLTLVAKSRARDDALYGLIELARSKSNPPFDPFDLLNAMGSDLPAGAAAAVWRQAYASDSSAAAKAAADWLESERRWFLDFALAASLGPAEAKQIIAMVRTRIFVGMPLTQLSFDDPLHIILGCLSILDNGVGLISSSRGSDDPRWAALMDEIRSGNVLAIANQIGSDWQPIADQLAWAIYLKLGVVTPDSIKEFTERDAGFKTAALRFAWGRSRVVGYYTPFSVLLDICQKGPLHDSDALRKFSRFLGEQGMVTWDAEWKSMDEELTAMGVEVNKVKTLGPAVLGSDMALKMENLAQQRFGLPGNVIWNSIVSQPMLWLGESDQLTPADLIGFAHMVTGSAKSDDTALLESLRMSLVRLDVAAGEGRIGDLPWPVLLEALCFVLENRKNYPLEDYLPMILIRCLARPYADDSMVLIRRSLAVAGGFDPMNLSVGYLGDDEDYGPIIDRLLTLVMNETDDVLVGAVTLLLVMCLQEHLGLDHLRGALDIKSVSELGDLHVKLSAADSVRFSALDSLTLVSSKLAASREPSDLAREIVASAGDQFHSYAWSALLAWCVKSDAPDYWRKIIQFALATGSASGDLRGVLLKTLEEFVNNDVPDLTRLEAGLDLPLKGVGSSWPN
jgi:hypothetical protein